MLYVDEVVLHNFRSFRNGTIKFSRGFNCIVGPNGSGKSSISSGIMFGLGESSLKRLDVQQAADLINYLAKPGAEEKFTRAVVKVKFTGDKEIEITRSVRSDKKVGYRLNGKHVNKQKVIEVLREAHAEVNATNTITQTETKRLTGLNPRERRVLIDVAAGISEFEEKTRSAMNELQKVDERIGEAKATLRERMGWLKDLESQKTAAERWLELKTLITRSNFTRLKMRNSEISEALDAVIKESREKSSAKQEADKSIAELVAEADSVTREAQRLMQTISAKNAEVAAATALLNETKTSIAVGESNISSLKESIEAARKRLNAAQAELEKMGKQHKDNEEAKKKLEFEKKAKSKNLPKGDGEGGTEAEMASVTERYSKSAAALEKLRDRHTSVSSEYVKVSAQYNSVSATVTELHKQINDLGSKRAGFASAIKSHKEAINECELNIKELNKSIASEKAEADRLASRRSEMDREWATLQSSLPAAARDSGRIADTLSGSIKKGYYGRAEELCTYDDKYSMAMQSAAGGRLGYFVVDSKDQAEKAISVLKVQKLGRASFIPLEWVKSRGTKALPGAHALLDLVKFDKKFQAAFEYIFSNTYIVDSISDAQKFGIGEHRFVTLEGDLVEQSGIVTGGAMKAVTSARNVERRLKAIEVERVANASLTTENSARLDDLRKKVAGYDTSRTVHEAELKHALADEEEFSRRLDELDKSVKSNDDTKDSLDKHTSSVRSEMEKLAKELDAEKASNHALSEQLQHMASGSGAYGRSKEEKDRQEALRAELTDIEKKIVALDTENEGLKKRLEELADQAKREKDEISIGSTRMFKLSQEQTELMKRRLEAEESINAQSKKTKTVLDQVKGLEARAADFNTRKGGLASTVERLKDDMNALEAKKAGLETRMTDIKAELLAYSNVEPVEAADIRSLENQIAVYSNEQAALGNVNLSAPEKYSEKKHDADDAQQKLTTLENEKTSIVGMIDELSQKKVTVFMDTLNTVNENFKRLFGYIFDGTASLKLKDPKDPFDSGLMIETTSKEFRPDTASGGQKALLSLILLLAIQIRRPMSFYILDEIDASLDHENAKKLSRLIKELSANSQFIVISHNNSLITEADTAIGVMLNKGSGSQTFGVEIKNAAKS